MTPLVADPRNESDQEGYFLPTAVHAPTLGFRPGSHFRFKLPLSFRERLRLLFRRELPSGVEASSTAYPIALEWQIVCRYLFDAGVIRSPRITFDKIGQHEPKVFAVRLWAAPSPTDGSAEIMNGGYCRGVSGDFDEALSKVFGELLERYPLTLYREQNLHRASIVDLEQAGLHFLDPRRADLFSEDQRTRYPRRRFNDRSIFRFVEGYSLTERRRALIPAPMVFINYRRGEEEPVLREHNSNGAGGFFTEAEATVSGLYELIQRDTFLDHWLGRRPPERIDPETIRDPRTRHHILECRTSGFELHILRLRSLFNRDAYITALIDRSGRGPALSLGGGCSRDPEAAVLRSIIEALSVRMWQREHRPPTLPDMDSAPAFSAEWGSLDRQFLWYETRYLPRFEFMLAGPLLPLPPPPKPVAAADDLAELLAEFKRCGPSFEVFKYRANHPVLDRLGYRAVKVCVPGILPLYMNETLAPLGAPRVAAYGGSLNPFPHPFP